MTVIHRIEEGDVIIEQLNFITRKEIIFYGWTNRAWKREYYKDECRVAIFKIKLKKDNDNRRIIKTKI